MSAMPKPKRISRLSRPLLVALSLCFWLQPLLLPVHLLSGTHSHTGLGGHFHTHGGGCDSGTPHDHEGVARAAGCFSSEHHHSIDDHLTSDDSGIRPAGGPSVLWAAPLRRLELRILAPTPFSPSTLPLDWPPEDPPEGALHSRAPPRFA